MNLDHNTIKKIRGLMLFAAVVLLAVTYIQEVFAMAGLAFGIVKPFLIGAAIAFVLNLPMTAIEHHLLGKIRSERFKRLQRPLSIVLALLAIVLVLLFVLLTVVPQLGKTITQLGNQIPVFINESILLLEKLSKDYPQIEENFMAIANLKFDWEGMVGSIIGFLKNGAGVMLMSTVGMAGSIVSGVVNAFIALVFAIYILAQKEKLGGQFKRVMKAYLPEKRNQQALKVCGLLNQNFSRFITGQCLEAVILGGMFFVSMSLLRFPYALLVGVLIAFTALVPIVGAFVGCFVGAFLILVDDPLKALWFVILFLVLQQLEGNLIYPRVVGSSVGLPSIWVLAAVSIGGSMFGILGMLVFIPLLSTFYALLRENVNARNAKQPVKKKSSGSQNHSST